MINLAFEYERLNIPKEKKSFDGLDAIFDTLHGKFYKKVMISGKIKKEAKSIYAKSLEYHNISDDELYDILYGFRKQFRLNKAKEFVSEALAVIVEVTYRVLGMRPYWVQLMGVLSQQKNFAIEMLPGEGKTITSALSAILAAWIGKPCHVVTSNDYLASRDALEMKPLYNKCSVSVGYIDAGMQNEQRKENYAYDVVYATSKELLADFLRDKIQDEQLDINHILIDILSNKNKKIDNKVMRGLYSCIVDEADSVLADEAITPLIISVSSKNEVLKEATIISKGISFDLIEKEDFTLHKKYKEVEFTNSGIRKIDKAQKLLPKTWRFKSRREFLIKQAISAKHFFHNHKEYIIDDEKIIIVDEKTGRLMDGRSWSAGLHQAIEAKENLELSDPTQTNVKMSFQRFFRLYPNLSGMSGTLQKLEDELWSIYKLPTIKIPKRIANTYKLLTPIITTNKDKKNKVVINEIKKINALGRPILVGTKDIKESESLAKVLREENIDCTVLNALHHADEASIIYGAGNIGKITIATNMAGRGTDIKVDDAIEKIGGLHVIATQKFSSIRVDLQLFGRTSRQGQRGSVQPIYSLEDELLEPFESTYTLKVLKQYLHTNMGSLIARLFYKYIQNKKEKASTKMRKKNLYKDFMTNEKLSFSHKN